MWMKEVNLAKEGSEGALKAIQERRERRIEIPPPADYPLDFKSLPARMRDPNVEINTKQSRCLEICLENPSKDHVGLQLQCERKWGIPVLTVDGEVIEPGCPELPGFYWKVTVAGFEQNSPFDLMNQEHLNTAISEGDELISLMLTSTMDLVASPDGKFGFEQRHNIDAQMTNTHFRATFKTHVKTKEKLTEEFQIFIHELGHHLGHPEEKVILQTLMTGKASSFALNVAHEY